MFGFIGSRIVTITAEWPFPYSFLENISYRFSLSMNANHNPKWESHK